MSFSLLRLVSALMCVLAFCTPGLAREYDILIRGGLVIDGTGSAPRKLDVGIKGDRIVAVGDLKGDTAKKFIDASKCVITPGFIDVHSHAKAGLQTKELSAANSLLVNGVTTVIIGPDGSNSLDLEDEREDLEEDGLGVNVAQMIGHGSIRAEFFASKNRQPTERQLEEMKAYVRRAMENGASGLAAEVFEIKDRGFIREGAFADVLVFDPREVKDRATHKKRRARSTGMAYVIVNGKVVIDKGEPNDAKAGIVLRHEYYKTADPLAAGGVDNDGDLVRAASGYEKVMAVSKTRIDGALVIGGGGGLPDSVFEEFIKLAGSADSHIVVIPTASTRADGGDSSDTIETWKQRGAATVTVLHTRDRDVANKDEFIAPLKKATGVWFGGGSQSRITAAYLGTAVERELRLLLKRGGVIGGSSAGAAIMTEVMIAGGNPKARTARGFGFLPGAVADQHFLRRNRVNRLIGVLQDHPRLVGFGIDEGTAIVVTGSRVRAVGRSYVTVLISGSEQLPLYVEMLEDGEEVDLTELSAAAARRIKPTAADKTEGAVRNRPPSPTSRVAVSRDGNLGLVDRSHR